MYYCTLVGSQPLASTSIAGQCFQPIKMATRKESWYADASRILAGDNIAFTRFELVDHCIKQVDCDLRLICY